MSVVQILQQGDQLIQFIIPVVMKHGRVLLRNEEQRNILDKVVRSTLHSFKVKTVNLYDMEHVIAYSFEPMLIGKKGLGGLGYLEALKGTATDSLHLPL